MDIFSFGVHFTDEQSCRLHYKAQRDKEGVICNRCGVRDHYWLQNGVISANPVTLEHLYEVVRLWKILSYLL